MNVNDIDGLIMMSVTDNDDDSNFMDLLGSHRMTRECC